MKIKDIQDFIKLKSQNNVDEIIDNVIKKIKKLNQSDWEKIVNDVKIKFRINLPKSYRLAINRYNWENLININPEEAKKEIAIILSIENGEVDENSFKKFYSLLNF
jgi:CRISPR/Cas system CSM-associated protein Csm2 small subunit